MKNLTHINNQNRPNMVNIGKKIVTTRIASAISHMYMPDNILELLDNNEIKSKKGPVFATAIIAGTMAVKNTHQLIPFCHPLPIEGCDIAIHFNDEKILVIECTVQATYKTGIEMEALTGASITALCIYDMCKAMSQDMQILKTYLISKSGGKSDFKAK